MPFGFSNAAQTFQRFVDHVLRGLPFVYAYIDDLLMTSQDAEEHKEHLALVLGYLDKYGVAINPSKCFGVTFLDFLGHHVDSEGLRPLPSKVEAIRDLPPNNLQAPAATFSRQGQQLPPVPTGLCRPYAAAY
ncbi:hypothetical protein SprV_0401417300 [Sparganum proliferum]